MHHANIHPESSRRPALDTVDSSETWRQTGACDLEPAPTASRPRTVFKLSARKNSSAKQVNDQTVMVGAGLGPGERQPLEAVYTDGLTEDDSAWERGDGQQSALEYDSSSSYSSFSDVSLHYGQQQGLYHLENIRLHDVNTKVAEQEATAMGTQTSESQDQIKPRDVLLGLWNEMSCNFAAKARLLRFDSRLPESNRAPLAVALDQMEAYHVQVVKYCMMHVDGFLDSGFNCFLTEEQKEKDSVDSSEKAKDQDRTSTTYQFCTRTQPLGLEIDCCAQWLVKDSPEAGHEACSGDEEQGKAILENSPGGASNEERVAAPSRSGSGGGTTMDSYKSSIAIDTEDSASEHLPEETRNSRRYADKGKSTYNTPEQASMRSTHSGSSVSARDHCTTTKMRVKRLEAIILSLDRACSQIGEMTVLMGNINRKLRSNYHILPVGVRHKFSQVLAQKSAKLSLIGWTFCHRMSCETKRIELVLASVVVPPQVWSIAQTEADSGSHDYQKGSRMRPLKLEMYGALSVNSEAVDKREDRGLGQLLKRLPALNCLVTRPELYG
ncbi:hypothetical protein MCOR25_004798 [Pyricularia grisea]|nr:hypothetical protein MCOR25_004798 [Pyricularia grisea]